MRITLAAAALVLAALGFGTATTTGHAGGSVQAAVKSSTLTPSDLGWGSGTLAR